jgi:hypothetical protein
MIIPKSAQKITNKNDHLKTIVKAPGFSPGRAVNLRIEEMNFMIDFNTQLLFDLVSPCLHLDSPAGPQFNILSAQAPPTMLHSGGHHATR